MSTCMLRGAMAWVRWRLGCTSHSTSAEMAPAAAIENCVAEFAPGSAARDIWARARAACRLAPREPVRRSLTRGRMPPDEGGNHESIRGHQWEELDERQERTGVPADTMSALLTAVKEMTAGISSEVIPESTAAACSCATRERLPDRRILMIGFAQPALAMDTCGEAVGASW